MDEDNHKSDDRVDVDRHHNNEDDDEGGDDNEENYHEKYSK